MEIAGRSILITGASSGFGRELAFAAIERGANVVATARKVTALDEIRDKGRDRVSVLAMDVCQDEVVAQVVAQAIARFGAIDILINNAGYGLIGSVEEASDAEIDGLFDVNFQGCIRLIRAVLPDMRARRQGMIVNMSSRAGVCAVGGCAYYAATKFAVEGLTEALAQEVSPLGIRAMLIEPGAFRTNYSSNSLSYTESSLPDYAETSGLMRGLIPTKHGQQPGDPVRAAHAILDAIESPRPPFRLILGEEAVATIEKVLRDRLCELEEWRSVSVGADYPRELTAAE